MRVRLRRNRFEATVLATFFVLTSALAFLFPRSGDDWAWGSQLGINRLTNLFRDYNGRYAGDLAILGLTRIPLLAPLILGATLTLTIFLVLDVTNNHSKPGLLLTILLFLLMPLGTWRESVVWLSGYSNYALAGLCILIYLRSVNREWLGITRQRPGVAALATIACFGFVAALFVEHVTLYLVAAGVLSLVCFRYRFGRFSARSIAWAVSFLVGAVVMFSNSAYRQATSADSQKIYQKSLGSPLKVMFETTVDQISTLGVTHNVALNVVVVIMLAVLLRRASATSVTSRLEVTVLLCLAGLYVALTSCLAIADRYLTLRLAARTLNGVAALVLLAVLVLASLLVVQNVQRRVQILVCCGSLLVLVAPLVLVSPVGPRCFYPTYLFFLAIVNLLMKEVLPESDDLAVRRLTRVVGVLSAAAFATFFVIYGIQHNADSERLSQIREQVAAGATAVTIKPLPFGNYVHYPDPKTRLWEFRYELFHHLPLSLKITVSPGP
jgi:hypothetical protein